MRESSPGQDQATREGVGPLIRATRRRQDMTLEQLGDATGLSVGYLSQIERGSATPSLSSLTRVAHALGAGVDQFIALPPGDGIINRADDRQTTWVNEGGMTYQRLHGDFPEATFSAYDITLPAGFVGEIDQHDGEEFVRLISGSARFEIGGQAHDLGPGDALHFRSEMRHQLFNTAAGETLIFWLGTSPILRLRDKPGAGGSDGQ